MKRRMISTMVMCWVAAGAMVWAATGPDLPTEFTYTLECRSKSAAAEKCGYTSSEEIGTNCCPPVVQYFKQKDREVSWDCTWAHEDSEGNIVTDMIGTASYHSAHRRDRSNGCAEVCTNASGTYSIEYPQNPESSFHGTNSCSGWTRERTGFFEWISSIDCYYGFVDNRYKWDFVGCINQWAVAEPWWWWAPPETTLSCAARTIDSYGIEALGAGHASHSETVALSAPYTTEQLIKELNQSLENNAWIPGASPHADATISPDERTASGTAVEAQFKVFCPANEKFFINYTSCYRYQSNGVWVVTKSDATIEGEGSGDWQYYPVPIQAAFSTSASNGCTYYQGAEAWVEVGCSGTGDSGCASGNCSQSPGTATASLTDAGLLVSTGLGRSQYGQGFGRLVLAASKPAPGLTTPAALELLGDLTGSEILRNNGVLRQVSGLFCLADVQALGATSFRVGFYTEKGGLVDGFYDVTGYTPFSTVTVAQGETTNQLLVTVANGTTRQYAYDWSAADQGWTLTSGDGLRKESRFWNPASLIRTSTIRDAADRVVYQEAKYYTDLPNYGRVPIRKVAGPSGPALTTQWAYYDNPLADGTNYGRLKLVVQPGGAWQRYEYDSTGRLVKEISQFLNAATNAAENLCRVVQYDYASLDGTNACETRVEKLLGQEIGRQYTVNAAGETRLIRCTVPSATWTNASNLVTVTRLWPSGEFAGKVQSVLQPDGTMQLYSYATDSGMRLTTTILSGQPNGTENDVLDGTRTVTADSVGPRGYLERKVEDILSGLPIEGPFYTYYDGLGRPYATYYPGSTSTTINYDCCGVASTVDRQGTVTVNLYDGLKRQVGTLRNGIITTNLLDAAGNSLATLRVGTDNSAITLRQAGYDVAGWLLAETNALDGVTTYSEVKDGSGQTVKTTIYPDGGQRIETYAQDGTLLKVTGSATFPVRYEYGVENEGGIQRAYTKEIKLNSASADTPEWTKTYTDMLGRTYKTLYAAAGAPYPCRQSFFNGQGQLAKEVDPDGITTLYQYNPKGELEYTATDMNTNDTPGVINFAIDRVTRTVSDVLSDSEGDWRRKTTFAYTGATANDFVVTSETSTSVDGNRTRTIANGLVTRVDVNYAPGSGERTVTTRAADGSYTIAVNRYGTNALLTRYDSTGYNKLAQTAYGHDAHGRQNRVSQLLSDEPSYATTTYYYNNADQVSGTVSPSPDGVQSPQVTTNYFDAIGRIWKTTLADSTSVTNRYAPTGLLTNTCGSRTYPVRYTYDAQGRMKTMTTWQNYAGGSGSAVTTWNYNQYRGWLESKRYADSTGPDYDYYASGRLKERSWVRGNPRLKTTYTYNNAGELGTVAYSDTTPGITYGYDRRGRQTTVAQGSTTATRAFDGAGNLLSETYSGGPLAGLTVTNAYDQYLRRTSLVLQQSGNPLIQQSMAYDAASRLESVTNGVNVATYGYIALASPPLVGQIKFTVNGAEVMSSTNQYDQLRRLTNVSTLDAQQAPITSFAYALNAANQRTAVTNSDNSFWVYQYDKLGQVTSGRKYWADGSPVAGQQFEYGFDDIGNRKSAGFGGDQSGANLRYASYTANNLNQYSTRTVPGFLNVIGSANADAAVTLLGEDGSFAPASRKGEYFRAEAQFNNSAGAVWMALTNVAVLDDGANPDIVTKAGGKVFLPQSPEGFGHDEDGNLTSDGRWTYTWDAENRLVKIESLAGGPADSKRRMEFTYDWHGRRIQKDVSVWNPSTLNYELSTRTKFVYDGWNLLAELDALNPQQPTLNRSYVWGTDLSGSMQGAGGVGGLLMVSDLSTINKQLSTHFPAYDGNGNPSALVNAADGTTSARYEYGPFGEVIRATGPMAKANPFRFSTKYQDDETDLLYYGYRYHSASTGRWLTRDPVEENGSRLLRSGTDGRVGEDQSNMYCLVNNNPLSYWDNLGLAASSCANPCDEAKRLHLDHSDAGGVVCCGGKKYACAWTQGGSTGATNKRAQDIIHRCTILHEKHHFSIVNCPCDDSGVTRPTLPRSKEKEANQSECEAYGLETICLKQGLADCRGDRFCEVQVQSEADWAASMRDMKCALAKGEF